MGALVPHTDVDRFVGIAPTDVSFIEQFKESGWVAIYKVAVRGFICVMKVVSNLLQSFLAGKQILTHVS